MKFSHFIANKITFSNSQSFTKVIIRIAIAAVSISVASMIITSAVIEGFKKEIQTKVFGFWGHMHVTDSNVNLTFEQKPIEKSAKYIDEIRDLDRLDYQSQVEIFGFDIPGRVIRKTTTGGVKHVQAYATVPGILRSKTEYGPIRIKGVDSDFDWTYLPNFIIEGRKLGDTAVTSNEMIVSSIIAAKYKLHIESKVVVSLFRDNKEIKRAFQVVGIYNTGLEEYDKHFVFTNLRKTQDLLKWSKDDISGVEIFLDDKKDIHIFSSYIYNYILPHHLFVETIDKKFPSIFEWLKLQDINELIIIALMIIVAIINMITILLVFILERTRMIGLLKSLGSTDWDIRKIFIINAAYIIFFGLLFGNVIGVGICTIQNQFEIIKLDEQNYYLTHAPVWIKWINVLAINLGSFLIILLSLVLPTYLINKIDPINSLRFE